MPALTALNGASGYDASRRIFDDIQTQFTLSHEALVGITELFLRDFHLGLSKYKQAMAMMYVAFSLSILRTELTIHRYADLHL